MEWIVALVIGLFAGWIAFRQYRTERDQVRLDLFEKRFAQYQFFRDFARTALSDDVELEHLQKLYLDTAATPFLFGSDIEQYRQDLHHKAVRLRTLRNQLERLPTGDERTQAAQEDGELMKWFADETNEAPKRFKKYMSFEQFRH